MTPPKKLTSNRSDTIGIKFADFRATINSLIEKIDELQKEIKLIKIKK